MMANSVYPIQRLPVVIPIGIQTETGVEEIAFDVSAWVKKWPEIEVEVWHRLPGQTEAYLTKSRREGDVVYWQVTSTDTQTPGRGKVELMGILPDGRKLSGSTDTRIRETICATTADPPNAPPTWVDTVREMIGQGGGCVDTVARKAAAKAQDTADDAKASADKIQAAVDETNAAYTLLETITITGGNDEIMAIERTGYGKIKKMTIRMVTPAINRQKYIYVTFGVGKGKDITSGGPAYPSSGYGGGGNVRLFQQGGFWEIEADVGYATASTAKLGSVKKELIDVITYPGVESIRIYTFDEGFADGTKFEIYGVVEKDA